MVSFVSGLTKLQLLAEAVTTRAIAQELMIRFKTMEETDQLVPKLGVPSR